MQLIFVWKKKKKQQQKYLTTIVISNYINIKLNIEEWKREREREKKHEN